MDLSLLVGLGVTWTWAMGCWERDGGGVMDLASDGSGLEVDASGPDVSGSFLSRLVGRSILG